MARNNEESAKTEVLSSLQGSSIDLEAAIDLFDGSFTSSQIAFGVFLDQMTLLSVYQASRAVAVPGDPGTMLSHLTGCITWATGFSAERFVLDDGRPVDAWRVFLAYLDDGCLVSATEPIAPTLRSRLRIPA